MNNLENITVFEIFNGDLFERQKYIDGIMNVLNLNSQYKVLAINSPWGTGKTTLIDFWTPYIDNSNDYKDNYIAIKYNAWENDSDSDPLVSLSHEISNQLIHINNPKMMNISQTWKKI